MCALVVTLIFHRVWRTLLHGHAILVVKVTTAAIGIPVVGNSVNYSANTVACNVKDHSVVESSFW